MSQKIYLTVADDAAWQALAVAAWGADDDGKPTIPRVVSVDGPFRLVDQPAVLDGNGDVVTPATWRDELAVNLAAPDGYSWPAEITAAAIAVQTHDRVWAI